MSEAAPTIPSPEELDLDRLEFIRSDPAFFARLVPEIRELRKAHYIENEDFPDSRLRSERHQFAGRMTDASWLDPNKVASANRGQRHRHAQVVAAFDRETDELRGYAYVTVNDSSKFQRTLHRFLPLRPLGAVLGVAERTYKRRFSPEEHSYAYMREIVRAPGELPGLEAVLGAAALDGIATDASIQVRKGTIYRLSEQEQLGETLTNWGYEHDGGEPQPTRSFGLGPNTPAGMQERWVSSDITDTRDRMLGSIGLSELPQIDVATNESPLRPHERHPDA